MTPARTVGMIGLGLVGAALAARLRDGGYDVVGHDRDPATRDATAALGIRVVDSNARVARAATIIVLALPNTDALEDVLHAIAPDLAAGTIVIDAGTDDPKRVEALADRLRVRDVHLLDVPLSGSSEQIRRGEGVAMGGGARASWDRARDVIAAMAPVAFHLGDVGSGSRAKLASNLLLGLNRAALAEALVFAEALGLDLDAFIALVRATPAYSRAVDAKSAKMIARDYTPESRIRQHRKDLALMLDAARDAGCALPLSTTHAELLDAAIAFGDGDLDNAAIIETIRRARA